MPPALAATLADLVMLAHFAFVLFVIGGALLVLRWPKVAWLHIPIAAYGAAIELVGWVCPLTPLEQKLRRTAGQETFAGGFIEHWIGRILYPASWGDIHVALGILVVVGNLALYAWIWRRHRRGNTAEGPRRGRSASA